MESDRLLDPSDSPLEGDGEKDEECLLVKDKPSFLKRFLNDNVALRVAPVMAFFGMCFGIISPVFMEVLKDRVCLITLNYSDYVCTHLNESSLAEESARVQSVTAIYSLVNSLIGSIPAIIFSVFLGSWSDEFGRKIAMLLPFVGVLLSSIYMTLCVYFTVHPALFFVSNLLASVTGGAVITHSALFSYIGDHTTKETRAWNIALIDGVMLLAANGGMFLGGFLMQHYAATVPYLVVLGLNAMSITYIALVIKEPPKEHKKTWRHMFHPGVLFSWKRVTDTVGMFRKQREQNGRRNILLTLGAMVLVSMCLFGDGALMQIYLEFPPFNWTVEFYSLFSAVTGIINSLSLVILVAVMRKVMHLPDTSMAMVGCVSAISFFFFLSIATAEWMIYLAFGLGILKALCVVIVRSLLTGMVEPDEVGKMMAAVSSLYNLSPLIGATVFSNIFAVTNAWWPGFVFVIGAFAIVPALCIFAVIDLNLRRLARF